ncbi:hypothetical protein BC834DRAFT_893099 [Gloeopeniophorella convolvens]|nr:hypothetical protein BC834DRAFT_893099 [Gloeopeniophorella convolvens]
MATRTRATNESRMSLPLPAELIVKILASLHPNCIVLCRQTCQQMRSIIDGSSQLQYEISLFADGMRHGFPSLGHISTLEKLNRLGEHTSSWRDGRWHEHLVLDSYRPAMWTAPFTSGNVITVRNPGTQDTLLFYELASPRREIDYRHWKLTFDFRIDGFAVDASQDLIVASKPSDGHYLRIHFLSMNTGLPHPLAQRPAVDWDSPVRWWPSSFLIRDSTIASWYRHRGTNVTEYRVWNWKTGQQIARLKCDSPIVSVGASFLGESHFAVCVNTTEEFNFDFALNVYELPLSHAPVNGDSLLNPCLSLVLPRLKGFGRGRPAYVRRDAVLSSLSRGVFNTDPRERLLALDIAALELNGDRRVSSVYIPHLSLLAFFKNHPPSPVPIPWSDWAQDVPCAFTMGKRDSGPRNDILYGMRCVSHPWRDPDSGEIKVVLYDFHPRRVAKAASQAILNGVLFPDEDPLVPTLPHLETIVTLPKEFAIEINSVFLALCEDALVVCDYGQHRDPRMARIPTVHILKF